MQFLSVVMLSKHRIRITKAVFWLFAFFSLSAGFALAFISPSSQIRPTSRDPNQTASSPHWQADGCQQCHEAEQKDINPLATENVDLICLSCHNSVHAPAEVHPIGRVLVPSGVMAIPSDWPLIDGKLGCLTCHDVHRACDRAKARPLINPMFLRDRWEGNQQQFCANCHLTVPVKQFIPHIMIKGSNNIINFEENLHIDESKCLFCHQEMPDHNTIKRSGDPKLRSEQAILCQVCHRMHRTIFNPGHMSVKISPDTMAYMYAREILGPTEKIESIFLKRLKDAGARPTLLVPDAEGNMKCTTCHNPHQENVFPPDSELAFLPMWLIGPSRITSPSSTNAICIYCHN